MDIRDSGIMPPLKGGADLFPSPDYCVSVTVRSRRLRSASCQESGPAGAVVVQSQCQRRPLRGSSRPALFLHEPGVQSLLDLVKSGGRKGDNLPKASLPPLLLKATYARQLAMCSAAARPELAESPGGLASPRLCPSKKSLGQPPHQSPPLTHDGGHHSSPRTLCPEPAAAPAELDGLVTW